MFDRPLLQQPSQKTAESQQSRVKVIFQTDTSNSDLITNPQFAIKQFRIETFILLSAEQQSQLIDRLLTVLQVSNNNCAILTESAQFASTGYKQNLAVVRQLQRGVLPDITQQVGCPHDLLFQLILIGLNTDKLMISKILRQIDQGTTNFERVHFELIYQYCRLVNTEEILQRGLNLLEAMLEQTTQANQVQSYFYFNGFLSGILLSQKTIQPWHFTKGFAACMWFNVSQIMADGKMQDPTNLPVLFNCYSAGFGGFECYFNKTKLYYRILPSQPYQPPTTESNGILIQEFQTEKWNYLAIEHDKPFLARAQLVAIVNDKQVVNFSMDYPKFDKQSKLSLISLGNNFIGKISSFIIFKEPLNNLQKFIQIYKNHSPDFKQFETSSIEPKVQDKLLLTFSPWRTNGKIVYDCIDMNDGELMINCGVWGCQQVLRKTQLAEQVGINGLLPILTMCKSAVQVNQLIRIVLKALGQDQGQLNLNSNDKVFDVFFKIIINLNTDFVDLQTIKLLSELRFSLQDKALSESFFKNLCLSADFWISSNKIDLMQEYWTFVKVIYSQNPNQYNQVFSIRNLINLMLKLSDTQQMFCCEYHKKNYEMFEGSEQQKQLSDESQPQTLNVDKLLEPISGVLESVLTSGGNEILPEIDHLTSSLTLKSCPCFQMQILKLLKGLLLDSKSNYECASPFDFSQRFLNAKGLEILLYLCANNTSLDIKAMSIKLIDVLSSHTTLIQMRIDTDLITYLSHVLLPPSLRANSIANQLQKAAQKRDQRQETSQIGSINYQVMPNGTDEILSPQKQLGLQFFSYQEAVAEEIDQREFHSEQEDFEQEEEFLDEAQKQVFSKTVNNFKSADLTMRSSEDKASETEEQQLADQSMGAASDHEEVFTNVGPGVPVAPKGTSKHTAGMGFKFGGLQLGDNSDSDAEEQQSEQNDSADQQQHSDNQEDQPEQQSEEEQEPPKLLSFQKAKPKGLANLNLQDDEEDIIFRAPPSRKEHQNKFGQRILGDFDSDEDNSKSKNDEEPPKPTQDVLMSRNLRGGANKGFNFALGADDSSDSEQEETKFVAPPAPPRSFGRPGLSLQAADSVQPTQAQSKQRQAPRNLKLTISEEDEVQEPSRPVQQNQISSAGNTGATNDIDLDDQPVLVLPQRKEPAKPMLRSLKLDTEKINELFNFGGEKGEMKGDEDIPDKFEQEIQELAKYCVDAMRRKKESIQLSEFQTLLEQPETDLVSKEELSLFNKPITVKGIRKIDIEDRKNRPFLLPDIVEENNLKHESIDQDENSSETQQADKPILLETGSIVTSGSQSDDLTNEIENIYTSCLEWILNRVPQGLYKTLMIDDYDKITFLPAMQVLMKIVTHSNNLVRQRALQDMFMLAQWDSANGQVILQHQIFHSWLLELLMPYQTDRQTDSAKAVYDMGTKLHTLLLKNACLNQEEEDSFKKVNLLARWPAVAFEKGYDASTAHALVRKLLHNLIQSLCSQQNMSKNTLKNLSHLTLQVHELVISSNEVNLVNLADHKPGNNESILQWIQRSFLSYGQGQNQEKAVWREWDICLSLVQSWDSYLFGNKASILDFDYSQTDKIVKQALLQKSQDELRDIVEFMLQDNQSSSSPSAQSNQKIVQGRLGILSSFNSKQADKSAKSDLKSITSINSFQAFINLLCLSLTQADVENNRQLQKKLILNLELYFKYAVTISELWRNKNSDEILFVKSQRKIAETCCFILSFLFQEIHTQSTPKSQKLGNNESRSGTVSPHSDLYKAKQYSGCMKACLIYLINLAGSQQLGTKQQKQQQDHAITIILEEILVKQYSTQSKPLISASDVSRFIESNFEEFPECFQQNDWKITFFHNSNINTIINQQLNIEMIQGLQQKRKLYAIRLEEAEASTSQANDEILKKIQQDTLQVVAEVTQHVYDEAGEIYFGLDCMVRQTNVTFNKWFKEITSGSGVWQVRGTQVFKQLKSQLLGEGQKCLMKDRYTNEFLRLKDQQLQQNIFKQNYSESDFLKFHKNTLSFTYFLKRMSKKQFQEFEAQTKRLLVAQTLQGLIPERKIVIECDKVNILKSLEKRTGSLIMTNYEVIFFYRMFSDENKSESNIFFFDWEIDANKDLVKVINLTDIKEIQRRRFLGQNKAIELFLMDNRTIVLDFFDSEQREKFAKKLLRQRQNKCRNLNYHTSLDPKWILKKSGLTEDWQNNKISNFHYLMSLNQIASRSYHDLSQYPVFPWILTLTKNNQVPDLLATCVRGGAPPSHFRDLTKNMQLLGSAERQAEFKRKFEDEEGFLGINDRFHCGSHYSNPGIVLHYMSRVQPYLEAHVVLQGNAMDHPDRIFQSVQYSYQHSLNDFSDVRELIPEFYCLPEMQKNLNFCNFGQKQDGTVVNDVVLPEWCQGDNIKFVQIMREAFESQYVSSNLNSWIDYIFGVKQRDQEAINSLNTFTKITYQADQPGDFDISQIQDKTMQTAYQNQGYNFGQTPLQLFKEKHPQKLPLVQSGQKCNIVVDDISKLKIYKPVPVNPTTQKQNSVNSLISSEAIMFAKFVGDTKIVGVKKEGFIQNFVWFPKPHEQNPQISFSLGSDKKSKFNCLEQHNGIDQIDRSQKRFDFPMIVINEGNYVVKGGYWDGRIEFNPVEGAQGVQFNLNLHQTTVTTIVCDKKEHTIITGTKTGEVIVWRNVNFDCSVETTNQVNPWIKKRQMLDHQKQITSIFINDEMCLFATASIDGFVNMYNLWTAQQIRTFAHPNLYAVYSVILSQSPLPMCAFFSREDHMWQAFTINGNLIRDDNQDSKIRQEEASHIVQPLLIKSNNHLDKLVYGTERGCICMRSLPSFEKYRKLQVSKDYPVLTLLASPDRRFLLIGCGDGGLVVITERSDQSTQTTQSTSSSVQKSSAKSIASNFTSVPN